VKKYQRKIKPLSNSLSHPSEQNDEKLLVGRINGFFGVRGWVKIFSHTEPRKNILNYQPWWYIDKGQWKVIEITNGREQSKTIVAHVKAIDNREQAQSLLGLELYINKSQLPELDNDELYWHELAGMRVVNLDNVELGIVDNMVATLANDVLVVKGKKEHWVPYIEPFLVSLNREERLIVVDWDEDF